MSKVAITYSEEVGGSSVVSMQKAFRESGAEVTNADYREMMRPLESEFDVLYETKQGREKLFAHAKAQATAFLQDQDCLALSGSASMIDPELFGGNREDDQKYDYSRTIMELALVHVATQKGMPILGICGGHQVVAVYHGGAVVGLSSNELASQAFFNYNQIQTTSEVTILKAIFGSEAKGHELSQFGAHLQKVNVVGDALTVSGRDAATGDIEALETKHGAPVVTTQFHPEIASQGLPGYELLYQRFDEKDSKQAQAIFVYFNQVGDAYAAKKDVIREIKSESVSREAKFDSKGNVAKSELDNLERIKAMYLEDLEAKDAAEDGWLMVDVHEENIHDAQEKDEEAPMFGDGWLMVYDVHEEKIHDAQEKDEKEPMLEDSWFGDMDGLFASLPSLVVKHSMGIARNIASWYVTSIKVNALREKERAEPNEKHTRQCLKSSGLHKGVAQVLLNCSNDDKSSEQEQSGLEVSPKSDNSL